MQVRNGKFLSNLAHLSRICYLLLSAKLPSTTRFPVALSGSGIGKSPFCVSPATKGSSVVGLVSEKKTVRLFWSVRGPSTPGRMSGVGPRLAFYPTLLYNLLLEKITSRRWYNRIDETIIVGALPFPSVAKELAEKENVKGVISLNEEYEMKRWVVTLEEWHNLGVRALYLPTVDLVAAPSQSNLRKGVSFILDHREKNESVYIHCKAGRTRSATLAACYLMTTYRWKPNKAVDVLMMKRSHIWLRQEQLNALDCYYLENVKSLDVDTEV